MLPTNALTIVSLYLLVAFAMTISLVQPANPPPLEGVPAPASAEEIDPRDELVESERQSAVRAGEPIQQWDSAEIWAELLSEGPIRDGEEEERLGISGFRRS